MRNRLQALRARLEDDPEMVRDVDELIALHQANLAKEFDYLPHPGAARGCYGWDFGLRGLSSMYFGPVDVKKERDYLRHHDMTDFSAKNKVPAPQKARELADMLAALEVLSLLVNGMYTTMAVEVVDAARRFMLSLRKMQSMRGPGADTELVAWFDDSFEISRACLAREDLVAEVKTHFQFNHESYARVEQRVTYLKVEAALKPPSTRKNSLR
ncbi:hypothetical protein JG688_00011072 [Phytophthora aleatoria]|uniref:Uncharacterized protein n=1 Tax=Phytophthora aleatoria TaxID=2496075 RepID=A0A8J5IV76_9STRA|nr:hypothetical protein JG688_00011072 [Phytophthora aleatoria]